MTKLQNPKLLFSITSQKTETKLQNATITWNVWKLVFKKKAKKLKLVRGIKLIESFLTFQKLPSQFSFKIANVKLAEEVGTGAMPFKFFEPKKEVKVFSDITARKCQPQKSNQNN